MKHTIESLLAALALILPSTAVAAETPQNGSPAIVNKSPATVALEKRRDELQPHIVQVSPRVWVSVGEDVSNVSMIKGKDGIVLVDTGQSPERLATILSEFRKVAPKDDYPIKTVIYTHGHGDHTGGSPALQVENATPPVWAMSNFGSENVPFETSGLQPLFKSRGAMQGGFLLPPEKRICNGIAPVRYPKGGGANFGIKPGIVMPDHLLKEKSTMISVAGLELMLFATPGETDDALSVWFPEEKVLFCGDNLYRSFPNIYPVRGVGNRDLLAWCDSLTHMLELEADALVPGHTDPFLGKDQIREVITNYRDAVKYVFDNTVKGMNEGKTPDQLVAEVKLPEHLARLDYLGEYYGNVAWTVRNIFNQYVGWFDGNPLHLYSDFTNVEEARRMVELVGGEDALLKNARTALERNDAAWAARLADHLIAIDPDRAEYLLLKADALEVLGETMLTATGRNFTLTAAQKLRTQAQKSGK